MRYWILGAGAVGSYIGGSLALAGQSVVFIDRPQVVSILAREGLRIEHEDQETHLTQPHVAASLGEGLSHQKPDVIVLTVKAYNCQEIARDLSAEAEISAPIVCVLNGIGNEETLAQAVGEARVIPATLTSSIRWIEPGRVRLERRRGMGIASEHPISKRLANELHSAGLHPVLYESPRRMKWSKALTNLIANATSAILGWVPARIVAHKGLYRLEIEAMREAVRVMRALGVKPQNLPDVPVEWIARAVFLPPALTMPLFGKAVISGRGDKLPSFCYDIGRKRSEAPWLFGAIVAEGDRMKVETPANDVLLDILMGLVEDRLDPADYHGNPELLLLQAQNAGVPGIRGYNHPRKAV
ncbi:MAG TPA: ketopantoate reductase family protein [Anaerolineae bacterium]|nr:ketopantoate reductase family protein [Anaerolineae bacterium]